MLYQQTHRVKKDSIHDLWSGGIEKTKRTLQERQEYEQYYSFKLLHNCITHLTAAEREANYFLVAVRCIHICQLYLQEIVAAYSFINNMISPNSQLCLKHTFQTKLNLARSCPEY